MTCLVCQKEFEGGVCPRCGFPVVECTDVEALLEGLRPQIEEYRRAFQNGIRAELGIYRWKESGGVVVLDRKELLPFGSYGELAGKLTWLPQLFARIPDVDTLYLILQISVGDSVRELSVPIRNLTEPSLQSVGIEINDDMQFRLKLKNDAGSESESSWMDLIA